jgi:hypothetical protein
LKGAVLILTLAVPGEPLAAETRISSDLIEFTYGDVLKSVYGLLKRDLEAARDKDAPEKSPARCPLDNFEEPCPVHNTSKGVQVKVTGTEPATCSPRCPICNPEVVNESLYGEAKPKAYTNTAQPGDYVGPCGELNCLICGPGQ